MRPTFRFAAKNDSSRGRRSGQRQARPCLESLERRELLYGAIVGVGDLGGGSSEATAINNLGQVVGDSPLAGGEAHAFLFSGGTITDLGTPGTSSYADGINDSGTVAGEAEISDKFVAFTESGGVVTSLGALSGADGRSLAHGINNLGQVVGGSYAGPGDDLPFSAFVSSGGHLINLGGLASNGTTSLFSEGFAINNSGVVVGYAAVYTDSTHSRSITHAFIYSGGVMTDLGFSDFSIAVAINDSGQVLVNSTSGSYIDKAGVLTPIPAASDSLGAGAKDINNNGDVVGFNQGSTTQSDPYLFIGGQKVDLNSLLPANSGWTLKNAKAINDLDQIIGTGTHNGHDEGYVLNSGSIVWNLNDSGPGSLRQAIANVNRDPIANGTDLITFAAGIQGGTIHILSPLPTLTRAQASIDTTVTIDTTGAAAVPGGGTDPGTGGGTGTGQTPAKPATVVVTSVQVEKVHLTKKKTVSAIIVTYSGELDPAGAGDVGNYQLFAAGKGKKSKVFSKRIKLGSAAYTTGQHRVMLLAKGGKLALSPALRLQITAAGILDSNHRSLDGNHDGVTGGDAIIDLSKSGVGTIHG